SLSPGPHTFEVDFQATTAAPSEFSVQYDLASSLGATPQAVIPDSMLDPAYSLKTSTTDPDGKTTTTSYSNATIDPMYGLPTATPPPPAAPATPHPPPPPPPPAPPGPAAPPPTPPPPLPAGNATTYVYYTGTGGPVAAACGVTASTKQGGQLEQQTDPDPGGG